jgi:hypothetical protein
MSTTREMKAWDKAVERQLTQGGGFCGYCGEACEPFVKSLPQELRDTACEFDGDHPDCGNHDMALVEKASETIGNFEIWECQNDNCDWRESV